MIERERLAWGIRESAARQEDIAAIHAGSLSLEEAQRNARRRCRQSGMSPSEAWRAFIDAQRAARR